MDIKIGDKYKLTSDTHNIIINEKVIPVQKKDETDADFAERSKIEKYSATGYHANLEKACLYLIDKVGKEDKDTILTLDMLVYEIRKAKEEIKEMGLSLEKPLQD
ncbi:zinc finger protein [Bacillus phage SBP8a]|nr:zinc finger protein [Bacillus phage SBP8a]